MADNKKISKVLARDYRPMTFDDLYGQDVLVQTITNALATGKVAQAYMLTGIRGVGKTTSARIIAKALNCIGPDGKGGMTPKPCGVCPHCVSIMEDRHMDVMEIDAASHTGVDNIREIIEGTKYTPATARYKVYIIDEVHMLSKQAFNALLKTLEEPPPQVKFIFATTEIRKVPLTILSRCQRFDLKRIELPVLTSLLEKIAKLEGIDYEQDAISLIAKAGEGSARDALSLLDQARVHATGKVMADAVREMLGFSDASFVVDLADALFSGKLPDALALFRQQIQRGIEPLSILQDFSDFVHGLTVFKLSPKLLDESLFAANIKEKIASFSSLLPLSFLLYAFQMLLRGIIEVRDSIYPAKTAEMVLIRLACLKEETPLSEKIEKVQKEGPSQKPEARNSDAGVVGNVALKTPEPDPAPISNPNAPTLNSVADLAALAAKNGEMLLFYHLQASIRPVKFSHGHFEFRPLKDAPATLAATLMQKLQQWTGVRWIVSVSSEEGNATLKETADQKLSDQKKQLTHHPMVAEILRLFPGAQIGNINDLSDSEE